MIVDCHTHLNNYTDGKVISVEEAIHNLELEMKRNRVDIALVLTSYVTNAARPSVKEVIEATGSRNHIGVVAGVSFEQINDTFLGEIKEFLQSKLIKGLKLYPGYEPFYPNDPKMNPVYELAAEFAVPVMLHSGDTYSPNGRIKYSHPIHIDDIAVDHRSVNFIVCHLGNPWIFDTMEIVYKNKNVYTDISGLVLGKFSDRFEVFMSNRLQELILFGVEPDKVLFGSDWPIASMESYITFVEGLRFPVDEKRKILSENAIKVFKLSPEDSLVGNKKGFWSLFR